MANPSEYPKLDKEHENRLRLIELTNSANYPDESKQYAAIQEYAKERNPKNLIEQQSYYNNLCKVALARRHEAEIEEKIKKEYPLESYLFCDTKRMLEEIKKARCEQLNETEKDTLKRFQESLEQSDLDMERIFPGGYDDALIDIEKRYLIREIFVWQEKKFDCFAAMNKAHTEILKQPPIRFYPARNCYFATADGEEMATVCNSSDVSTPNGMSFSPAMHVLPGVHQHRQAIKNGTNLLGPVMGGLEFKNADLIGHTPIHECDHVRLISIAYFFYKEIKEKMGFPDDMDGIYFDRCVNFIAYTRSQELSAAVEKELGYLPERVDQETSTSQGMSAHGWNRGVAELTAEAHVNGQSGKERPQKGDIVMIAYGKASNKSYEESAESVAKRLAKYVFTKEGYRDFKLNLEFAKRGYRGNSKDCFGNALRTVWCPFHEFLTSNTPYSSWKKDDKTLHRSFRDAVFGRIVHILDHEKNEIAATREINKLMQTLYDVKKLCDQKEINIEQIYEQEKEIIEKNPYYQNNFDENAKACALMSNVLRALEAKCQTLAKGKHAKAPMVVLGWMRIFGNSMEPYDLPTLKEIDDEWYQKFGKSQGEAPPTSVEEDEFTQCLRKLLKDPSYKPTPENNPLSSPIISFDSAKPIRQPEPMSSIAVQRMERKTIPSRSKTPTSIVKRPTLFPDTNYEPQFTSHSSKCVTHH